MSELDTARVVDQTIRGRRTTKAYANTALDVATDRTTVDALIEAAGWAPFHRKAAAVHLDREDLNSVVPWRFYILDAKRCRRVRQRLLDAGNESKVPRMLAAATALIQITWLPNPPSEGFVGLFEPTVANMEHIAATSAAIQNLLLSATAHGFPTYWSSGGALRDPEAFGWFGIPTREILLGSVFLFPTDLEGIEHVSGGLREHRGDAAGWSRWVKTDELG